MKHLLAMLLLIVLLLAGCQTTPERPIVIQKDLEQMLDTAQKDTTADAAGNAAGANGAAEVKSLAEQYGIPADYSWEWQGANGIVSISVNAPVTVPAGGKMPIYRVTAADFSQETVSLLFNRLCADKNLMEVPNIKTKSEIEREIIGYRRSLEDPEYADSPNILESYVANIAELEALYPTAPETVAPVPCTGQLKEIVETADGFGVSYRYTGVNAYNKDTQTYFVVNNNSDLKEALYQQHTDADGNVIGGGGMAVRRGANLHYFTAENFKNYAQHPLQRVLDENAIPAEAIGKLSMTPAEARQLANSILGGTDMVIRDIYLTDDENFGNYDGKVSAAESYAYRLYCVRQTDGIPQAFLRDRAMTNIDSMMAPSWHYEYMVMDIGNEGVFSFDWVSPHTIGECLVENAALLPFEEVMQIFGKMLPVTLEAASSTQRYKAVEIEIDHIVLELQRIIEQNSIENGLLVPVWNFYGTRKNTDETGEIRVEDNGAFDPQSLLTINAIDGSIIDIRRGY